MMLLRSGFGELDDEFLLWSSWCERGYGGGFVRKTRYAHEQRARGDPCHPIAPPLRMHKCEYGLAYVILFLSLELEGLGTVCLPLNDLVQCLIIQHSECLFQKKRASEWFS
ncbi:hypothetical protein QVD17_06181 [Tagetes erecta]|uniref:Uncharacterized protein n=1 Tax=Tagetes erecta TaxID=13708 RepID=A0AAD8PC23_TARER|nr:hypothetical protein QVD17_06181 [Tagetes erecta]